MCYIMHKIKSFHINIYDLFIKLLLIILYYLITVLHELFNMYLTFVFLFDIFSPEQQFQHNTLIGENDLTSTPRSLSMHHFVSLLKNEQQKQQQQQQQQQDIKTFMCNIVQLIPNRRISENNKLLQCQECWAP